MDIRISTESDRPEIAALHQQAFGEEQGSEIADLVEGLLDDTTAVPLLSLVAVADGTFMGHILFTRVIITPSDESVQARILAPLAVLPTVQGTGIGRKLINEGLRQLKKSGVELVFVLGHPGYYPRCGFKPAQALGFEAPYPIPEEHAAAWMVLALDDKIMGKVHGRVECADVLNEPHHWRE